METATVRAWRILDGRRTWIGASALAAALALSACDWGDLDGVPAGFADGVDNEGTVTAGPGLTETGGVIDVVFDDTGSDAGIDDTVARGDHNHWDETDPEYVLKAGDMMTGALILNADPATGLEAATKQYVDAGRGQSVDGVTTAAGGDIDLIEGANVTITSDDAADTITIAVAGGAGLEADTVDGAHLADLAVAVHAHLLADGASDVTATAAELNLLVGASGTILTDTNHGSDAETLDTLDSTDFWKLGGNTGTTPGTDFLGTTDDVALEIHVSGARALMLVPETNGPSILGGHQENYIEPGAGSATVSGGGATGEANRVYDSFGTIGGGRWNQAGDNDGGVGTQMYATVGGGYGNYAENTGATVAGGITNFASGNYAAVPGGHENTAAGDYSLAAGLRAKANHQGAFILADSTGADFASAAPNEFAARATGGVRIVTGLDVGVTGNLVAGHESNAVAAGAAGVVVAGGGSLGAVNLATDDYSVVAGGLDNQAGDADGGANPSSAPYASVGGGLGNTASGPVSSVGGGTANTASGQASVVAGGWWNQATNVNATVAGGFANAASGANAAIGGGYNNVASASYAVIAGGGSTDPANSNRATDTWSAVGGGHKNLAGSDDGDPDNSEFATVGGGDTNTASGEWSTVPGGRLNNAVGDYSFAAGRRAQAVSDGAFVWADSTDADFASTAANQFLVRASGGVGIGTTSPTEQLSVSGSAEVTTSVRSPVLEPLAGDGTALTIRTNDAAAGSGGITIQTGSIPVNGGTTGSVTIRAGNSAAPNYNGGRLTLGGYPNSNAGGGFDLLAGDGWSSGGAATIRAGDCGWGQGGSVNIRAGNSGDGGSGGGAVVLNSGAATVGSPGAVAFQIAGAERMRVHSDGNVGINTASPGSALHVAGPIATATREVAADDALTDTDSVLFVDSSGASRTITLPAASAATVGRMYYIYKADASFVESVTVQPAGTDALNGATTITQPWGCLRVIGHTATSWIGSVTE